MKCIDLNSFDMRATSFKHSLSSLNVDVCMYVGCMYVCVFIVVTS